MHLTANAKDNVIVVDGDVVQFDADIDLGSGVQNIQWSDGVGQVQYTDRTRKPRVFDDPAQVQGLVDMFEAEALRQATVRQAKKAAKEAARIAAMTYRDRRAAAYAAIEDQLDMMYWDRKNGTNTWFEHVDAVRKKYPKERQLP